MSTDPSLTDRSKWNVVPGVAGTATGNCNIAPLTHSLLNPVSNDYHTYSSNTMLNPTSTNTVNPSEINGFYQSLHQPYLLTSIYLSQSIKQCNNLYKKDIKFIASIGGWNMGASKAGKNLAHNGQIFHKNLNRTNCGGLQMYHLQQIGSHV